jgi:hypothetical protein
MIHNSLFNKLHRVFFYLFIMLIPTQLGIHFWPSWTMVLGRRIDYLSPTLYLTDILIIFILLCWFIDSFPRIMNHESGIMRKFIIHNSCLPAGMALFIIPLLFVFTNIWFAGSRPVAVYTWIKSFEFILLGVYIVKTKPKFEWIVFFLSVSVLYSSLIAVVQFLLQHSIGGVFWFLGERTFNSFTPGIAQIPLCLPWVSGCPLFLRAYGTFPHPNVLGGYIAVLLPLLLSFSRPPAGEAGKRESIPDRARLANASAKRVGNDNRIEWFFKWFYGITIILGVLALVFTFSRSAWMAGVIAIVFTFSRMRKRESGIRNQESWKYISGVVVYFILYSLFMIHDSTSESVIVRNQLNTSAISIIQQSPIFGVGLGNFLVKLPEALPSRMIYFLQPVHNIYLLLVSEVGLVGSIIIGWLFWKVFRKVTRDMRHVTSQKNNALRITCYVSLVTLLMLGFVDHYPLTLQQGRLLLTLFISLVFF